MKLLVFLINHNSGIYGMKDFQKIKKENHPVRTVFIHFDNYKEMQPMSQLNVVKIYFFFLSTKLSTQQGFVF